MYATCAPALYIERSRGREGKDARRPPWPIKGGTQRKHYPPSVPLPIRHPSYLHGARRHRYPPLACTYTRSWGMMPRSLAHATHAISLLQRGMNPVTRYTVPVVLIKEGNRFVREEELQWCKKLTSLAISVPTSLCTTVSKGDPST